MCGLLGFCLPEANIKSVGMGAAMSIGMDKRGGHSWGYWADGEIQKGLGELHESVPAERWMGYRRVIGHTRLATTGAKIARNSHPFTQGRIIGAHNGMVYNHDDMQKKYKRDFEVDSQHIFQHINDGLPLSELDAYGAIVYLDTDSDVIHLGRFHGGSLHYATLMDDRGKKAKIIGYAWCTTQECLTQALNVAGWPYWESHELKEGHTYWIDETENRIFYSQKKDLDFGYFIKPTTTKSVTPYHDYDYTSRGNHTSPKTASQAGAASTGTNSNIALHGFTLYETNLMQSYDSLQYRRVCENCQATEKCMPHPQFHISLCFSCRLDMDEQLNTLDAQVYEKTFRPTVVPPQQQLEMPV